MIPKEIYKKVVDLLRGSTRRVTLSEEEGVYRQLQIVYQKPSQQTFSSPEDAVGQIDSNENSLGAILKKYFGETLLPKKKTDPIDEYLHEDCKLSGVHARVIIKKVLAEYAGNEWGKPTDRARILHAARDLKILKRLPTTEYDLRVLFGDNEKHRIHATNLKGDAYCHLCDFQPEKYEPIRKRLKKEYDEMLQKIKH